MATKSYMSQNLLILVGALEHEFYFPIFIGDFLIPIDSYFSEGLKLNHQPDP